MSQFIFKFMTVFKDQIRKGEIVSYPVIGLVWIRYEQPGGPVSLAGESGYTLVTASIDIHLLVSYIHTE